MREPTLGVVVDRDDVRPALVAKTRVEQVEDEGRRRCVLAEELRPDGASVGFGGVNVTGAAVTVAQGDQCQAVSPFVAERLDAGSGDSVEMPHVDVGRAAGALPQSAQRCCCVAMPTSHEINSDGAAPTVGATRRVLP